MGNDDNGSIDQAMGYGTKQSGDIGTAVQGYIGTVLIGQGAIPGLTSDEVRHLAFAGAFTTVTSIYSGMNFASSLITAVTNHPDEIVSGAKVMLAVGGQSAISGLVSQITTTLQSNVPGAEHLMASLVTANVMPFSTLVTLSGQGVTGMVGALGDLAAHSYPGAMAQIVTLAASGQHADAIATLGSLAANNVPGALTALSTDATKNVTGALAQISALAQNGHADAMTTLSTLATSKVTGALVSIETMAQGGNTAAMSALATLATNKVGDALSSIETMAHNGVAGAMSTLGTLASHNVGDALTQVTTMATNGVAGVEAAITVLVNSGTMTVHAVAALGGSTIMNVIGNLAASGLAGAAGELQTAVTNGASGALAALEHQLQVGAPFSVAVAEAMIKTGHMPVADLVTVANNGSLAALAVVGDLVTQQYSGAATVLDGLLGTAAPGSVGLTSALVLSGAVTMDHLVDLATNHSSPGAVFTLGALASDPAHNSAAIAALKALALNGVGDAVDAQSTLVHLVSTGAAGAQAAVADLAAAQAADQLLVTNAVSDYLNANGGVKGLTAANVTAAINSISASLHGLHTGLTPVDMATDMAAAALYQMASASAAVQNAIAVAYGSDLVKGTLAVANDMVDPDALQLRVIDVSTAVLVAAGIKNAGVVAEGLGLATEIGYSYLALHDEHGILGKAQAGLMVINDPTSLSSWTDAAGFLAVNAVEDEFKVDTAPLVLACTLIQSQAVSDACTALFGSDNNAAIQQTAKAMQGMVDNAEQLGQDVISNGLQTGVQYELNGLNGVKDVGMAMLHGDINGMKDAVKALVTDQVNLVKDYLTSSVSEGSDLAQQSRDEISDAKAAGITAMLGNLHAIGMPSQCDEIVGAGLGVVADMWTNGVEAPLGAAKLMAQLAMNGINGAGTALVDLTSGNFSGAAEALRDCMSADVSVVKDAAMAEVAALESKVLSIANSDTARALVAFASANVPGAAAAVPPRWAGERRSGGVRRRTWWGPWRPTASRC